MTPRRRRGSSWILRGALLCGLAACEGDESVSPLSVVLVLEHGAYSVSFDRTALEITLYRGEERLTSIDGTGLSLGTVDALDDSTNYDPYPLVAQVGGYTPPTGTRFRAATRVRSAHVEQGALEAELEHEGGLTSRLSIRTTEEGSFRFELVPSDAALVAWLSVGASAPEGEAYYGLGEVFDAVNHRGRLRAMQIEVDELESANNEAHVPVPFVIGTGGWGLFVESSYTGVFDVAGTRPDRVTATFGTGSASAQGLVFHLFAAEQPIDLTGRYYQVTGFPRLPAPWALGPLVWRDENDDQAQVEADLDIMRDLDLATSGIWIDRPYATAVNTFDFDPAKFPDAPAMIAKAHALGFRVGLWHTPYLDEASDATLALRNEALEQGYFPVETGFTFNGWGDPIDFTAEGAIDWWQSQLDQYKSMGIEGFKLDYAEDVVPGLLNARNVYLFRDGSDERTMHRGYTLLYHRTYAEMLPEQGGMLLCRAGKWGDQVHGPIIWPGDLDARFWTHRQQVTEDGETFKAVGGLPASVIAGLSLGPSGFPFYGADTGGYRHSPPDKETFRRWFEQTALSSVMQIGTSSNDVAWEFGDDELLSSYRTYTRLHLRLFPYAWSLAHEMLETGRPIQRPFGLVYPALGEHPDDQYLFGDALLVAPVLAPGVVEREVFFPDGAWVGFWEGEILTGPAHHIVPAPLGTLPLFLSAGSLVPMLRPGIDTLSPTSEPDRVDSFANDAGDLWVLSSPGPDSMRVLYDGASLRQSASDAQVALGFGAGEVFDRGVVFELIAYGPEAPSAVRAGELTLAELTSRAELEAGATGFFFEPSERGGTLLVRFPQAAEIMIER